MQPSNVCWNACEKTIGTRNDYVIAARVNSSIWFRLFAGTRSHDKAKDWRLGALEKKNIAAMEKILWLGSVGKNNVVAMLYSWMRIQISVAGTRVETAATFMIEAFTYR